ncbi:cell division protein FtsB [Achromobacter sp. Marseille-Q4962]|uniref:cell division protein FtsB n=2 Tax=unclassified Achromobacter TaxID=2626865 RepID=UPI002072C448|nr:cell division protein FtsB [Achromobacter sp. Marseille-Q4962]
MRLLFLVLFVLLGLIQYPLWLGKGGWFKVWDLQRQVAEQRETNEGLRARNAALEAEVRDLQTGTGAIEERARGELGMMREGEVFVHILPKDTPAPAGGAVLNASASKPAAKPAAPARAQPAGRPAASAAPGNATRPPQGHREGH